MNEAQLPATIGSLRAALLGLFVLLLALLIYLGAWAVSDEVYAANAARQTFLSNTDGSLLLGQDEGQFDVAWWKHTLVAACPLH